MGKASTRRKPVKEPATYHGRKASAKRSDRHWIAPDGELWDSRYEYLVYIKFRQEGINIQRCDKSDSFSFTLPIRGGKCGDCGSDQVGQQRTFTPDFRIVSEDSKHPTVSYYLEAKGYIRAKERSLLRAFNKAHPSADVRYILQSAYRASKPTASSDGSIVTWFSKFMKGKTVYVWNAGIPDELKTGKGPTKSSQALCKSAKRSRSKRVSRT